MLRAFYATGPWSIKPDFALCYHKSHVTYTAPQIELCQDVSQQSYSSFFSAFPHRLLKKLKKKNEQQIELEKKEQGFSIYVNGANVELGRAYSRAKSRSSSRHTKTAGGKLFEVGVSNCQSR